MQDGGTWLYTLLIHSSGQWIESRVRLVPKQANEQSIGSSVTYFRRYAYAALVGVVTEDEDDDGEMAMQEERKSEGRVTPQLIQRAKSGTCINEAENEQIRIALEGMEDLLPKLLTSYDINNLADLPREFYQPVLVRLRENRLKRMGPS